MPGTCAIRWEEQLINGEHHDRRGQCYPETPSPPGCRVFISDESEEGIREYIGYTNRKHDVCRDNHRHCKFCCIKFWYEYDDRKQCHRNRQIGQRVKKQRLLLKRQYVPLVLPDEVYRWSISAWVYSVVVALPPRSGVVVSPSPITFRTAVRTR